MAPASASPAVPGPAPLAAVLMGATASGKTALAVELARRLPIEVISADSRQVYRHLDVGTAKPTPAERAAVQHHLVDFIELDETYNAARFARDALGLCEAIRARGRVPLVVGGAGFYLHVLREGLFAAPFGGAELRRVRQALLSWSTEALREELARRDPRRLAAIHPNDRYRLSRALEICIASGTSVTALTAARPRPARRFLECRLVVERDELHRRIAARTARLLEGGWIDEVRALLERGVDPGLPGLRTLGYPHVVDLVRGRTGRALAEERVNRDTRRFARRQETWFRKAAGAVPLPAGDPGNAGRLEALLGSLVPR